MTIRKVLIGSFTPEFQKELQELLNDKWYITNLVAQNVSAGQNMPVHGKILIILEKVEVEIPL